LFFWLVVYSAYNWSCHAYIGANVSQMYGLIMNYLAYGGYCFYGAADAAEMASTFASYGLLASAPTPTPSSWFGFVHWLYGFF